MAQNQYNFRYQWFKILKDQIIGNGSYGAVYKAKCDQLTCAAKVLHRTVADPLDPGSGKILQRFRQECDFLNQIRHPHIVQYLGVCWDPDSNLPALLMELLDGSLTKMLESSPHPISYHIQVDLCHHVALAIAYLHSNDIIHCDLSGNNVLVIAGRRAKVTDFGISRIVGTEHHFTPLTLCPGAPDYMSPESLIEPPRYTEKLDVFSQGVIMIQVCTREFPDPGPAIKEKEDPDSPTGTKQVPVLEPERRKKHIDLIDPTHPLLPIALGCLEYRERDRPSAEELCQRLAALEESQEYIESIQATPEVYRTLQQERDELARQVEENSRELAAKDLLIARKDQEIARNNEQMVMKDLLIAMKDQEIVARDEKIAQLIKEKDVELQKLQMQLQENKRVTPHFQRLIPQAEARQKVEGMYTAGSDNLCPPSAVGAVTGGDDTEKSTQELFHMFQDILAKLNPQQFQRLAEQALELEIDSEERLMGCVDMIFTKAIQEPNRSLAYANLCKVLSPIKVDRVLPDGKTKSTNFRRVLLTKLQQEFEKDKKDDEDTEKMLKAIEEAKTPEAKKQLQDELQVAQTQSCRRYLGNFRFIGELFKLKMLSEIIMHECIVHLLRSSSDEEALECFAQLITTIGKDLDHPQAKTRIDNYFNRIDDIIKKGKITTRTKFMLQDVRELRRNGWTPRTRQDHWQTKRDRRDKEIQREKEREREKYDPKRILALSRRKESGPPALGPRAAPLHPNASGWGSRGAAGVGSRGLSIQDKDKKPSRSSSRGSKHNKKDYYKASSSGSKRSYHSTATHDSQKVQQLTALQMVKQMTSSKPTPQAAAAPVSMPALVKPVEKKLPSPTHVVDNLDEETLQRKTGTIIDELVSNKDFQETVECVKELRSPGLMNVFVAESINHTLEKSPQARQCAGELFARLIREEMLSQDKFVVGLNDVLEFAEDIEVDVPRIWQYLGEILSNVMATSVVPLSVFSRVPQELVESGKASKLVAQTLVQCRGKVKEEAELVVLWKQSQLQWTALGVNSEDLGEFLSRQGLEFLQEAKKQSSQEVPYLVPLTTLIRTSDATDDEICKWIQDQCTDVLESPEFVFNLTTAVFQAVVSGSGTSAIFNSEAFNKRARVIKNHVKDSRELQMSVLYALQIAVTKLEHPPRLLNNIFNLLYDLDIIEEEIFFRWRDRGTETYGKGNALVSVKSFFEWLQTESEEEESETF